MPCYIIATGDGFTSSPNGEDFENLQVLGIVEAETFKSALKSLSRENPTLKSAGFDGVVAYELKSDRHFYSSL